MRIFLIFILFVVSINCFSQDDLIVNGNFSGAGGWIPYGNFYLGTTYTKCPCGTPPCTGYAYLSNSTGGADNNLSGYIYQVVTIPVNCSTATLEFCWNATSTEATFGNDKLSFEIYLFDPPNSNLNPWTTYIVGNSVGKTESYTLTDPNFLKEGTRLGIRFFGTTNATLPTTIRLDDVSFIYQPCALPVAPTNLSANVVSQTQIDVNWNSLNGAIGYEIDGGVGICPWGSGANLLNTTNCNSCTTTSFTGLNPSTNYRFIVLAKNSCGWSTTFNCVSAKTSSGCTAPLNPPAPTKNSPSCGSVTLARDGTVPSNETWYWQGTSCGTSTDLGSGPTYNAYTTGTYFIRAYNTIDGCWSNGCGSVDVTVTPGPTVTANSNSPVTAPNTLNLTATTISGASYSWTGPNGYTSTEQNPTRNPTTISMSGQYCVTANVSGCESVPSCRQITVDGTPPSSSKIIFTTHNERLSDEILSNENTDQSVSSSYLKICADGSRATKVEFTNNNPDIPTSNIKFWIKSDPYGNHSDTTGYFVNYNVVGNVISAEYQHPLYMNWAGTPYRNDAITVVDYNNGVAFFEKPIRIYRAPILFVHGWRGDASTFQKLEDALIYGEHKYTWAITHRLAYPNTKGFKENINAVSNGLIDLFTKSRKDNFSAGKADVIAHSMGGILSRLYLQANNYKNDIRRLITLNTPHSGSQGANFLYHKACEGINIGNYIINNDASCPVPFAGNDAVRDMRVNSSGIRDMLNGVSLNRNTIPSFAITTQVDFPVDEDCSFLNVSQFSLGDVAEATLIPELFSEDNDFVVAVSSQRGGLSKSEHFFNQCHLKSFNDSRIIDFLKPLLEAKPDAISFSMDGYHPPVLNPPTFNNVAFNRPATNSKNLQYASIDITNISSGQVFNPGQQINIAVVGSEEIKRIVVASGNESLPIFLREIQDSTGTISYTIPSEASGTIRIIAVGYDTSGYLNFDTVSIKIFVNALLDSLSFYNKILRIPVNKQTPINIIGYFNDSISRDISFNDSTDFVINDTNITNRVEKNIFFGKQLGNTTLLVSLRDKNIQIPVEVYKGEELISTILSSDTREICKGSSINFKDISIGTQASRQWYFSGGNPSLSTEINPVVTYSDTGHFNVTLIANFSGQSDTLELKNYVGVSNKNTTVKSGNWNNPETWGCLTIPSQNDSAVIATGDTLSLDASIQIKRLNIELGGLLQINDSSKILEIGNDNLKTSELLSDGSLKITNGTLKINGSLNVNSGSSFNMSGGTLIIDGNTGDQSTSIPDGQHLFNVSASSNKFNLSGGTLQFINPPFGPNSQTINCPYNFSSSSTVMFGDGVSTIASNNPNGFGGNLLPSEIGKVIFDPAIASNNRIFRNLNSLIIRGRFEVKSGNFVQQEFLQVLDSISINSGLAAWYNFSGNTDDSSGNGNDGVIKNGTFFTNDRFGNSNSAVQLDGIDDYIEITSGNTTSLNITGDFTVSFWVKTSDNSGNIASLGDNVNLDGGGFLSGINGGNVGNGKLGIATRGNWTGSINSISDNNWHHIAYTLKNDTLKIYIDNVLDKEVTGVLSPLSWNGNRVIGCRNDLIMTAATNYEGILDDLFIYNRALSQTEINYLYMH